MFLMNEMRNCDKPLFRVNRNRCKQNRKQINDHNQSTENVIRKIKYCFDLV